MAAKRRGKTTQENVTEDAPSLPPDELRESFIGPAILANRMYLTITSSGARIAFMEQLGSAVPAQFRTAVILSFQDALALRDLISQHLKGIEETLVAAVAESKEPSKDG